jgi:predicted DNA-binding transcriptional regulator YafY
MLRQAARTFRVDRIGRLAPLGRRPRHGDPEGRRARPAAPAARAQPRAHRPAPRTGFFPAPPDPPPGSPQVRIWLEE